MHLSPYSPVKNEELIFIVQVPSYLKTDSLITGNRRGSIFGKPDRRRIWFVIAALTTSGGIVYQRYTKEDVSS